MAKWCWFSCSPVCTLHPPLLHHCDWGWMCVSCLWLKLCVVNVYKVHIIPGRGGGNNHIHWVIWVMIHSQFIIFHVNDSFCSWCWFRVDSCSWFVFKLLGVCVSWLYKQTCPPCVKWKSKPKANQQRDNLRKCCLIAVVPSSSMTSDLWASLSASC